MRMGCKFYSVLYLDGTLVRVHLGDMVWTTSSSPFVNLTSCVPSSFLYVLLNGQTLPDPNMPADILLTLDIDVDTNPLLPGYTKGQLFRCNAN